MESLDRVLAHYADGESVTATKTCPYTRANVVWVSSSITSAPRSRLSVPSLRMTVRASDSARTCSTNPAATFVPAVIVSKPVSEASCGPLDQKAQAPAKCSPS